MVIISEDLLDQVNSQRSAFYVIEENSQVLMQNILISRVESTKSDQE